MPSPEDFLAAEAAVGPAAGALLTKWAAWTDAMGTILPVLLRTRIRDSARSKGSAGMARGAWGITHAMMLLVDTASREWGCRVVLDGRLERALAVDHALAPGAPSPRFPTRWVTW